MATQLPLEDIISGAQNLIRQSQESSKKKQEIAGQMAAGANKIAGIYETVASDLAVVKATQEAAQLKVQAENSRIAASAGVNIGGANVLLDLHSQLAQANQETIAATTEYKKKMSTSFFENPLDYIVNQVTLPFTEDKLKGAAAQSQTIAQTLINTNNALQESFQTTEKLKESTSTTSAAAATRVAAAEALMNAEKASIEGLKYNMTGVEAAQQATAEQLNAQYQVFSAVKAEQQVQMALKSHALQLEQFNWAKQEKLAAQEAKAEGKAMDDQVLAYINDSLAASGMPVVSGLEAKNALQMLKSGASKEMVYHYENGRRMKSLGVATIGSSPAESARVLQEVATNLPDVRKETTAILADALGALGQNKAIDKKDKGAVDAFVNSHVKQTVELMYKDAGAAGSLFNVGDLNSYLTLGAVKDLPVVTKVLAPMGAQGQSFIDPKLVLQLTAAAVKKGTITSSQAAEISQVYRLANNINQQARGFLGLGIVPPNAGKNYYVKLGMLGKPADIADPAEINRYLSKELSKTVGNKMAEGRASSPFLNF